MLLHFEGSHSIKEGLQVCLHRDKETSVLVGICSR